MIISNPVARIGEDIVTNYLKKKGYKIIERNFRKVYGKIQKLIGICEYYKLLDPKLPESMCADAVLIDMKNGEVKNIEHVKNISGF